MWLLVAAGLLTVEVHDAQRAGDGWRIELGATALTIDGTVMDPGGEWTVLAGGAQVPVVERRSWATSEGELVIEVVLKRTSELAELSDRAHVPLARLAELPRSRVVKEVVGAELLAGVDAAVTKLAAARPLQRNAPLRRVVVVVADGLDADPRAERYTQLGQRAAAAGVRIHTVAWHPRDDRRPMLGLAELSARSHGTFRVALGPDPVLGLAQHVDQLFLELHDQPLLTIELPAAALGAPISVRHAAIDSRNRVTFVPPAAAGKRGLRWWWIAGPAVLLAGAASTVIVLRRRKAAG
jgi:hypothetical protein